MMDEESESSSSDYDEEETWISKFCSQQGNQIFCEVDEEFISDSFNLCGLDSLVKHYSDCRNIILNKLSSEFPSQTETSKYYRASCLLYGLIHARYIVTPEGLEDMHDKFIRGDFGSCPRVLCNGVHLLPTAITDVPCVDTVKLYCPSCNDIYEPEEDFSIDGAFFGTTFAQLFYLTYPDIGSAQVRQYEPKIFGFRISNSSAYYKKSTPK